MLWVLKPGQARGGVHDQALLARTSARAASHSNPLQQRTAGNAYASKTSMETRFSEPDGSDVGPYNKASRLSSSGSHGDFLHLVGAEFFLPAVIELRHCGQIQHGATIRQSAVGYTPTRRNPCYQCGLQWHRTSNKRAMAVYPWSIDNDIDTTT
jgi:hypothetical protein